MKGDMSGQNYIRMVQYYKIIILINSLNKGIGSSLVVYKRVKKILFNTAKKNIYNLQSVRVQKIINKIEVSDLSCALEKKKVERALRKVSIDTILQCISMAEMPLIIYLLSLKYRGNVFLKYIENDAIVYINRRAIANMSYLAVYIHFIEVNGDVLRIEGNVSLPIVFAGRSRFIVKCNDIIVPCQFQECGLDLKLGNNTYERRLVFVTEIPISEMTNTVTFFNCVDGKECVYGKINAMRFSPIADCIDNQFCRKGKWILYIDKNKINCEMVEEDTVLIKEKLFEDEIRKYYSRKAEWAIALRRDCLALLKKKEKPIWLFIDRIDRADDNAEVLFDYVRKYEKIDSYFIIQKGTQDYKRLSKYPNVVPMYSREHMLLVLVADFVISSQANGAIENPFWDDAELFRDYYHNAKIIFLQHGIIKDDMSLTLSKYHTNFKGFVTSCKKEKESILEYPYYYTEKEVWLTGLPRYDRLYNAPRKYILIMPTWRQNLMEAKWDDNKNCMLWEVKGKFSKTDYYKKYASILANMILKSACEKYGYKLVFMPHPLMEPYLHLFKKESHCLYWNSKKSYRDAFAEGNLLVTDYSSVAFDFSYLKKPVVYYQFDKTTFFEGHTYKRGYFDYEKEETLINTIIEYMKNSCTIKKVYESRIESTYEYMDDRNCERVVEYILKCSEE